jgi:hypothetical protein
VTTGRELARHDQGDGFTAVTVALGADRQAVIIVPTDFLDQPGYQEMLDAHATKQANLVRYRDEGGAL